MSGNVLAKLHYKQGLAFESPATEILYGGAAGGGKSHLMRIAAISWAMEIPGLQIYLFRRQSVDLEKNHMEGPTGFRMLLHPWVESKFVEIVKGEIRFKHGSKIFLCHCKDEADKFNYYGIEMHVLLIDELTHFTESIYRFLRSRVRLPSTLKIPEKYEGLFPRVLCSSNPGSIGHHWVKKAFIDSKLAFEIYTTGDDDGGFRRQFIPAKLDDNPSLDRVSYERNLSGVGAPALVKALRDGDWNAVLGAYFPEFGVEHQIEPFKIPDDWTRFRCFDWGSYRPFACYWIAVSDGTFGKESDFKRCKYPSGSLVIYREWYGMKEPNVGLGMSNWEIAKGIQEREEKDTILYGVADPSIFKEEGGPSIAEQFARRGVLFRRGDNERLAGAAEFRARLIGEGGVPMVYIFTTCTEAIRTISALQHDDAKPENWDTDGEDHAFDAIRYGIMSRPYANKVQRPDRIRYMQDLTMQEVWEKCRIERTEERF